MVMMGEITVCVPKLLNGDKQADRCVMSASELCDNSGSLVSP